MSLDTVASRVAAYFAETDAAIIRRQSSLIVAYAAKLCFVYEEPEQYKLRFSDIDLCGFGHVDETHILITANNVPSAVSAIVSLLRAPTWYIEPGYDIDPSPPDEHESAEEWEDAINRFLADYGRGK